MKKKNGNEVKIAILHDYLNQFGGAERVLQVFLEMFPEADLYTLFYDRELMKGVFAERSPKTSFLDLPLVRRRHHFFIPFMPLASELLRGRERYDFIVSDTAGYAKGFNVSANCHVSYCHTPLRYAWEDEYQKNVALIKNAPFGKEIARLTSRFLRHWDKKAAEKPDILIANSRFIAGKIKKYYGREAEVIHPPVRSEIFYRDPEKTEPGEDFYLMVGRLVHYKRFDLGIQAIAKTGKKLKIMGTGPELEKLKKIAGDASVEFLGRISDRELHRLYNLATALIFPQTEDFGLIAAEAQACGLPVIAYGKGGALEIVENGKTGIIFNKNTPDALASAIGRLEKTAFDREKIAVSALRFSEKVFREKIMGVVNFALAQPPREDKKMKVDSRQLQAEIA